VNEALVRATGVDDEIVGRSVVLPELGSELRIVGVVADVTPITPGASPEPEIYWSNRQLGRPATFLLVRTRGDATDAARSVTDALRDLDPTLALGTPQGLARAEQRALVRPRFQAMVLLAFAVTALALATTGVYAVVAYIVGRRAREIGIRMALGADTSDVVSLVLRSNLTVAAVGIGLGMIASLWVGRAIRGMIHGVSPSDPWSFAGSAVILLAASGLSMLLPTRRALRSAPLRAIRSD